MTLQAFLILLYLGMLSPKKASKQMEVREALQSYLDSKSHHLRPKTLSEKRRIIGYFSAWCTARNIALGEIRPKIVDEYLDYLKATHHGKKTARLSTHTVFLHI